jgi:hypothetical protein
MYKRDPVIYRQVMQGLDSGELSIHDADRVFQYHGMRALTKYERRHAENAQAKRAAAGRRLHPFPAGVRPSYLKKQP